MIVTFLLVYKTTLSIGGAYAMCLRVLSRGFIFSLWVTVLTMN